MKENAKIYDFLDTNIGYQHQEAFEDYLQDCKDACQEEFGIVPKTLEEYCQKNWLERD